MGSPLYRELASLVDARLRCLENPEQYGDWATRHESRILVLARNHLPRGSGVDCGTTVDLERSTGERLVLLTQFHHMDDHGYDGWTEHTVFVTPSLQFGLHLRITGVNRNNIKDYLHELFDGALREEVE